MAKIGEECAVELFDKDLRPEIEVGDEVKNETGSDTSPAADRPFWLMEAERQEKVFS